MSVIEAGRNRETTAREIENASKPVESRLDRLKGRLSNSASLQSGDAAGVGDPFAEVFARIAASEAPPPTSSTPESSSPTSDADEERQDNHVAENDRVAAVNDLKSEADAQRTSTQAVPVLVESDEQETEAKAESETAEAIVLPVSEKTGEDQPGERVDTETELGGKGAVPAEAFKPTNDHESDSEPQEFILETQEDVEVPTADPEVAPISAERIDRRRYETDQARVVDQHAESEIIETPVKLEQSTRSETGDESSDEQSSRRPAPTPLNQSDDGVERRRYSDDPGHDHERVTGDPDAPKSQSSEQASIGQRSKPATAAATSANGSIDVSAMTPAANASALSAGVATAVAAQVSASVSSSLVGIKGTTIGSVASVNATGGPLTGGPTTGGTTSPAASEPSNPGVDTPGKNSRGDATSQPGPHGGTPGTDTLSAVQRAKLVQRVSRGFQHLGPNGGQIRMRLSPEALGSVQLQLNIRNGELSGTMVTQTDAASEALREQLPQLRKSLETQGIRLEKIDIETESATNSMETTTSDRQFGDSSGHSRQQSFGQSTTPGQTQRTHWSQVRPTQATERTQGPITTWSSPSSGVDLRA